MDFAAGYKAKIVLLDFWASWCRPCLAELPNLTVAYERFRPRGFEILGVNLDGPEDVPKLARFCADHKVSWPQICDGKAWNGDIAKQYYVDSIPMSFLVDGDSGLILLKGEALRGERLIPALEKALAEKAQKQ